MKDAEKAKLALRDEGVFVTSIVVSQKVREHVVGLLTEVIETSCILWINSIKKEKIR